MNKFFSRVRQRAVGKGLCSVIRTSVLSALSFPVKVTGSRPFVYLGGNLERNNAIGSGNNRSVSVTVEMIFTRSVPRVCTSDSKSMQSELESVNCPELTHNLDGTSFFT